MEDPTATWTPGNTRIMMWGKPIDWQIESLLQMEGDQHKSPDVIALLGDLAAEHKLERILSPTMDFSSNFLDDGFQSPWQLTLPGTGCKLHRGLRVDGFEIHPGDAGIIAPADCAVIVVTMCTGRVFMLHAGRDSLVDRHLLNTGTKKKRYESIVFTAWAEMSRKERLSSEWFILPSISSGGQFEHRFDDPKWGEQNEHLVAYLLRKYGHTCVSGHPSLGRIDIPAIIAAQLVQYCMADPDQVVSDSRCTYKEVGVNGDPVWHSNARAIQTGGDQKARNLVVVMKTR